MLESLYNVGCNSTGRQLLLEGIFSAEKVSPVASPFQSSSPVITDNCWNTSNHKLGNGTLLVAQGIITAHSCQKIVTNWHNLALQIWGQVYHTHMQHHAVTVTVQI